ncbi:phosphatidylinositol-3,5-bisphosphate 5-phosphatase [Gonapodya sp. JEL0774]|nr:phosphatidylinositol-3,5-bisphosphate 5-phosphatase [Gonapodya sp. JEL0774]
MGDPLHKFTLWETRTRYYIVGSNITDDVFRILKIDRTSKDLEVTDDPHLYTKTEVNEVMAMVENGNKSTGGLSNVLTFHGILGQSPEVVSECCAGLDSPPSSLKTGFVRFLEGYYLMVVTKRRAVGLLGGHYVYHIDATNLISIPGAMVKIDRKPDESRYVQVFQNVDLSKNFYYSYTYDITRTLQHNLTRPPGRTAFNPQGMFVWNYNLLVAGFGSITSSWALPVIHGFVDQAKISVYGRNILVTLIARRSRHYAGARFLKRGVSDQGYVANDVETEQIVNDATTTSFYVPRGRYHNKAAYTSFVQHRGSIPLFWSQDTTSIAPKPPIELTVVDPYFSAAALHFDEMFKRYGTPIIVLNLVKSKEKTPRESILLNELTACVTYLNKHLPPDKKLIYIAWDMARASKSEDHNVVETLEEIGKNVLSTTGFFHSGPEPYMNAVRRETTARRTTDPKRRILGRRQNGVVRTNCVDCIDRTNAAQFVIGKCALGQQLYALGVIDSPQVPLDCDAVKYFRFACDLVDQVYADGFWFASVRWITLGQHNGNIPNSFTDAEKQDAINLFLGTYLAQPNARLWDLNTDYHLHNEDPRIKRPKRSYIQWWSPDNLGVNAATSNLNSIGEGQDDPYYFAEHYRPTLITSFANLFAFNMISTLRSKSRSTSARDRKEEDKKTFDFSPFTVRTTHGQPNRHFMLYSLNIGGVKRWLTLTNKPGEEDGKNMSSRKVGDSHGDQGDTKVAIEDYWGTSAMSKRLLQPQVTTGEYKEYRRYVNQFRPSAIVLDSGTSVVDLDPSSSEDHHSNLSRPLSIASGITKASNASTGSQRESPLRHPDYRLFTEYVNTPTRGTTVLEKDEEVYKGYVDVTKIWVPGKEARSSVEIKRYDGYNRYVSTGRFVTSHTRR